MAKTITEAFASRKPKGFFNEKYAIITINEENIGGESIPKGVLVKITGTGRSKTALNIKYETTGVQIHNVWCGYLELVEKVGFKIELQDNGQDFLFFITDQYGTILKAEPFQSEIWKGCSIPLDIQQVNGACLIKMPSEENLKYLNHEVISITKIVLE